MNGPEQQQRMSLMGIYHMDGLEQQRTSLIGFHHKDGPGQRMSLMKIRHKNGPICIIVH